MKGRSGPIFNVVGEKVALGPLRKDLAPLYQRWMNDLESARSLGGYRPFTFEEEEEWYAWLVGSDDIHFTIYERGGSKPRLIPSPGNHFVCHGSRVCPWRRGMPSECQFLQPDLV